MRRWLYKSRSQRPRALICAGLVAFSFLAVITTTFLSWHSYRWHYRVDYHIDSSIETISLFLTSGSIRIWWNPANGWQPQKTFEVTANEKMILADVGERGALGFYYSLPPPKQSLLVGAISDRRAMVRRDHYPLDHDKDRDETPD